MHIRQFGPGRLLALSALGALWVLALTGCSKPSEQTAAPALETQTAAQNTPATTPATPAATPAAAAKTGATPVAAPQASPTAQPKRTRELPPTQVLAHTKFGDLTLRDMQAFAMTGLVTPLASDAPSTTPVIRFDRDKLNTIVQWIGARKAAYAEVKTKNDPAVYKFIETNYNSALDQLLFTHILRTEILDQVSSPTQSEIYAYYEKEKPLFFQPFTFTIRMLLLATYDTYLVQSGDTLEGIAQQVNGDPKTADNIRSDVPSRPLRREPNKMFKPLIPGEKLLVPMGEARKKEVRGRLEAILKEIEKTSDSQEREIMFTVRARKYDESGFKGEITTALPTGTRQNKAPLSEITKVVHDTPVGHISQIFQTKHGYQAIMVVDKEESHTLPLSDPEVRAMITEKLSSDRLTKATENLMNTLLNNPKLKIDYKLIADGDRLSTDTVVITLGDEKVAWRDIKEGWASAQKPKDQGRIIKWLAKSRELSAVLFRNYLKPQMDDPKSDLSYQIEILRTAYLGSGYITKLATEEAAKLINADKDRSKARAFYDKNRETLYKKSAMAAFDAIQWPLPADQASLEGSARQKALSDMLAKARAAMAEVKTVADFANLKARMDQNMVSQGVEPMGFQNMVPITGQPPQIQKALDKLQAGKWSEPFIADDQGGVMVVMVRQTQPAGYEKFEDVVGKVALELFKEQQGPIQKKFEDEFVQRAGIELLVKEAVLHADE